jgi:hypothetical protein
MKFNEMLFFHEISLEFHEKKGPLNEVTSLNYVDGQKNWRRGSPKEGRGGGRRLGGAAAAGGRSGRCPE